MREKKKRSGKDSSSVRLKSKHNIFCCIFFFFFFQTIRDLSPYQAISSERKAKKSTFELRNNILLDYSSCRRMRHKEYVWLQISRGEDTEVLNLALDAALLDMIRVQFTPPSVSLARSIEIPGNARFLSHRQKSGDS